LFLAQFNIDKFVLRREGYGGQSSLGQLQIMP